MTNFCRQYKLAHKFIDKLAEYTGVDHDLVTNIVQYAKCLMLPGKDYIDMNIFIAQMNDHFDLTSTFMIEMMFVSLKGTGKEGLTVEEYCKCICAFLTPYLDQKIDYVYRVYDSNIDGELSYLELYSLLKTSIIQGTSDDDDLDGDPDNDLKELIYMAVNIMDQDQDRLVSSAEFHCPTSDSITRGETQIYVLFHHVRSNLMTKKPYLMDILGPCLPTDKALQKFVARLKGKSPLQVKRDFEHERIRSLNTLPLRQEENKLYPIPLEL